MNAIPLIPYPVKTKPLTGTFTLKPKTVIVVDKNTVKEGKYLAEFLFKATGFEFKILRQQLRDDSIALSITPEREELGREGYMLSVRKNRVTICAPKVNGIFYGMQTLRQLLPLEIESRKPVKRGVAWSIPCVNIKDSPRFQWRGLMIDCSRTFWSKTFIKRIIKLMSLYKMNRLHLHLTDDQGWRVEIKKHPKLTEIGSKFAEEYNEPAERQGYYTQDDIKEIVACGARYNVTIVPEIEMPGHSMAALTVYPELSCTGGPFEIFPFFKGLGICQDILCAGNNKTFKFLEDVLSEIVELFPSKFIHIGGDEAPKQRWRRCPKCQARMRKENLKNERELQSYFIKRVEKFLNRKGKRLIGWDEILEGGLAPHAVVMSWRGTRGGIIAVKAGHDAIMSPKTHCYFDYNYRRISTIRAYKYEPIPRKLSREQAKHILGAQANFWSHIDRTENRVAKQIFPRLLSIAEVTWSPKEHHNKTNFTNRLRMHGPRLKKLGVKFYRDPAIR